VTLDTNVLGQTVVHRVEKAVEGLPIELGHVSVTAREQEEAYKPPLGQCIPETGVCGESRWDQSVWSGEREKDLFKELLTIISNGSFPRVGNRDSLSHGQRNQLRDVMILVAHVRSGRDIFVTNETRAFGKKGSSLRQKLESRCSTQIMNVEEFSQYCDTLRK
jgi:hypothetical protein